MPVTQTGPFFFSDIYKGDIASPNYAALVAATNIVGVILKVTQGLHYDTTWFHENWPKLRAAGGDRYGASWFRGGYVFGEPDDDGARQCDYALDQIAAAGGFGAGDLPLAWDLEGDAWTSDAQRRKISMQFAARYLQCTGQKPILYSNGDVGVGPADGFSMLWTPHPKRLGAWPVERWPDYQYAGDGQYYDPNGIPAQRKFPLYIPGWGKPPGEDMNVVLEKTGNACADVSRLAELLTGRVWA
jgi:GH25 family lysozyme M1 (1,4-beta-N-acetylmuramidase)